MDLILFGGQSNMQGQSEALTDTAPIAGAFEYRYLTDSILPLRNPVGEDIRCDHTPGYPIASNTDLAKWLSVHVAGSACYGHTNLVPEFCKAYVGQTENRVTAVHIAKGSTVIADWLPDTPGYEILVKKSAAAIKKVQATEPVGHIFFVWLQGESDAIAGNDTNIYKQALHRLQQALSRDIGIEAFGIIRVGCFTNDARDHAILNAQTEICTENDAFLMLTDIATALNTDPKAMHPHIPGHFSAKGLEILGREGGTALGIAARSLPPAKH